jgi:hypothetical protein
MVWACELEFMKRWVQETNSRDRFKTVFDTVHPGLQSVLDRLPWSSPVCNMCGRQQSSLLMIGTGSRSRRLQPFQSQILPALFVARKWTARYGWD